jgi:hypothetical protein
MSAKKSRTYCSRDFGPACSDGWQREGFLCLQIDLRRHRLGADWTERTVFPSGAARRSAAMEQEELLEKVRALRGRRYSPAEVARALSLSKAEAARLVRVVACERDGAPAPGATGATDDRAAASQVLCWVSPGWRHGLRVEARPKWPDDIGPPTEASDSGVAFVLVAVPDGHNRLSMCGYLVDTWCLGVKNAMGPKRMTRYEFQTFKRHCYGPWESEGMPVQLEFARHLVFGAVDYARSLGFEPHPDFTLARRALGSWEEPSAITFGRDGKPFYLNGPYEDPQRVLAALERAVGRGGFDFAVSLNELGDLDDGYRYTISTADPHELDNAA